MDQQPRRPASKDERRSSMAATASTTKTSSACDQQDTNRDTKRPLNAVMSEDFLSSAPFLANKSTSPPISSTQKQSFLSKFARSEVKSSKSIDKSSSGRHNSRPSEQSTTKTTTTNNEMSISNNNNNNETESDRGTKTGKTGLKQSSLASNMPESRASKSFCEGEVSESIKSLLQRVGDSKATTAARVPPLGTGVDNDDDDNNQVLPAWPSRIEAAAALEPALVQHQVYSLKDYSQVAGPSETVASSNSATANNRLQKSMSQDRKVSSRTKRMSECILAGASIDISKTARQQRLPSMIGKISASSNLSGGGSGGGASMNTASSVNSLLLPTTTTTTTPTTTNKNPTLIGESRYDRMRKLFVSPLSLRGSTAGTSGSGGKPATAQTHSAQSRLSLQAGANMLNKPHHLMHMYRARVAVGAHHSRRSPMRQKQGNMKGFRVYGCPLSMANTMYPITCFGKPDIYKQQAVPYILARLCNYIEENSSQLTHEGIFRVSGNARLMEKLKTLFDHLGDAPLESESVDVATSASMLKMYLRELPDPLIPTRMNYYFFTLAKKYSSLLFKSGLNGFRVTADNNSNQPTATTTTGAMANAEASSVSDSQSTLDRHKLAFLRDLTKLIRKLPIENYNLLKYLACFLHRISLKQQSNKMSAEALGIVFGPNVFRIRSESYKGLKEQELSNQIMASIISNYKQLFDCELTDPLGNLVVTTSDDELLHLSHEREGIVAETKASQSSEFVAEPSCSRANKSEHAAGGASSSAIVPTQPSASTSTYESVLHHQTKRCPKHGRPVAHYAGRYSDDGDESDDATVDDDDDDDECDEDSYSQTSDSGSYCSSLASDTVESTYEGDIDGEGPYDDGDGDDDDGDLAGTSSDCNSETSYTPSSSHSDSDDEDAGAELSSSNFSSNASLTGAANDAAAGMDNVENSGHHKPCSVCRRRESAQLEASNKMREQLQAAAAVAATSGPIAESEKDELANASASPSGQRPVDVANQSLEPNQLTSGAGTATKQNNGHRMSTRRKRAAAAAADADGTKRAPLPSEHELKKPTMSSSDIALNVRAAPNGRPNRHTASPHSAGHSRHGAARQLGLDRKQLGGGLLRRRSSSASSLLGASNRPNNIGHNKTRANASKDGADHNRTHHAHHSRTRATRMSESARGTSSRKSRLGGRAHHQSKRERGEQQVGGVHNQPSTSMNVSTASTHRVPIWDKGNCYVPELLTLNLSPKNRRDLVWNYVSSALMDLPQSERFFQLRSYNSDETLLRSQPEAGAGGGNAMALGDRNEDNEVAVGAMARRRFSGQDHLQANQQNLLANACTEFNQIFETYEGGGGGDGGDTDSMAIVEVESLAGELLRPRGLGSTSGQIDTSMISLLGDQMPSFNHSSMSLNGNGDGDDDDDDNDGTQRPPAEDPIVAQLKVTRDLAKTIQKLIRHGMSGGFNQDVGIYLFELLGANFATSNCATNPICNFEISLTCYIDHLTGRSVVETLDELKRNVDDLPTVDMITHAKIVDLLGLKVDELKKRYNNLKYIREHYHRHHLARGPAPTQQRGDATKTQEDSTSDNAQSVAEAEAFGSEPTSSKADPKGNASKPSGTCKFGALCPVEFVFNIEKHLARRRQAGARQVKLNDMTLAQLRGEKLEIQKNLLRYEHWFGRPTTRAEFNLVGHLYERYRAIKIINHSRQSSAD